MRIGTCDRVRKSAAKSNPFSTGIITSSTMMSKANPLEKSAGLGGRGGDRHAMAVS